MPIREYSELDSDNPSGGYWDDSPWPMDLPSASESDDPETNVPPTTSFSTARNVNADNDSTSSYIGSVDPTSPGPMSLGDASSSFTDSHRILRMPYLDDPSNTNTNTNTNNQQPHGDEEANAIFVDGTGPSSAPASYHRKTLAILILGICIGIIVMIALLLGGVKLSNNSARGNNSHGFDILDNFADDDGTAMEDAGFEAAFFVDTKSGSVNENGPENNSVPSPSGEPNANSNNVDVPSEENPKSNNDGIVPSEENEVLNTPEQKEEAVTATVQNPSPDQPAQVQPAPAVEQVQPAPAIEQVQPAPVPAQVQPAPVPAVSSNPDQPDEEVDINLYCGECPWRAGRFSCEQRTNFLVSTYQITAAEAQVGLLKQGHCDISKQVEKEVVSFLDVADDCRTRPKPGEIPLDDFCGNCEWKRSGWDCFYRIEHLIKQFETPELEGMQGEMKRGNCLDSKTEEDKKDQGLDLWCGICKIEGDYCDRRAQSLDAKLALLADGKCTLPQMCETGVPTTATASPIGSPTSSPTSNPTISPSTQPTNSPIDGPTTSPTNSPTTSPTTNPSSSPTTSPTTQPTTGPTTSPTTNPSISPTTSPSTNPTTSPTTNPSTSPTTSPTTQPTTSPTSTSPTQGPTNNAEDTSGGVFRNLVSN